MLETILREIIAGSRQTPHHLEHGARLDYDAQAQQLTITRLNRATDEREMSIFRAYIKRVGYRVSSSSPAELEPGINASRSTSPVMCVTRSPSATATTSMPACAGSCWGAALSRAMA